MCLSYLKFQNETQALSDLEKVLGFSVKGYVEGTTSVPRRLQFDVEKLRDYLHSVLHISGQGQLEVII